MTAPPLVNGNIFYSRLNTFRVEGLFTDVTIECVDGGDSFRCHRLVLAVASDYFKDMFSRTFKERTSENIILMPEVRARAFQEILRLIYTGDTRIDYDNFWDVFRASKVLGLSGLRDSCISFVKQNTAEFAARNFSNMHRYAQENKEDQLTYILRPHLIDRLDYKANKLLKESLNVASVASDIMKCRLHSSTQANIDVEADLPLRTRYIRHGDRERLPDAQELAKFAPFKNINPKFEALTTIASQFISDDTPATCLKSFSGHVPAAVDRPFNTLYIYVRFKQEDVIRIFSIDSSTTMVSSFIGTVFEGECDQNFTTVAAHDDRFLYRLECCGEHGEIPAPDELTFFACTSADMRTSVPLKLPPVYFEHVNLAAIGNNIYAYHESLPINPVSTPSARRSRPWTSEELARGIFVYDCGVDDWYPVPAMKSPVFCSSMTVLDDTLFLIGGYRIGERDGTSDAVRTNAQAFDSREGVWRALPKTKMDYFGGSACCLHRKIYVSGGCRTRGCERYDPVAGKWERLSDLKDKSELNPKSIAYQHKVWLFDRGDDDDDDNAIKVVNEPKLRFQMGMNQLNAESSSYGFSWSLGSINLKPENPTNFVDGVVFKKI